MKVAAAMASLPGREGEEEESGMRGKGEELGIEGEGEKSGMAREEEERESGGKGRGGTGRGSKRRDREGKKRKREEGEERDEGVTLTDNLNRMKVQLFFANRVELLRCLHSARHLLSPFMREGAPLLTKLLGNNLPRPATYKR